MGRSGGAVLMPGLSGAGKSTFTAYLARNGWQYGGDDIVGLSKPTGADQAHLVLPFCSAVSVKEGALDLLADLYPGLRDLPVIPYDLKKARFPSVPSEHHMTAEESGRKIKAIVFPAFSKGALTELVSLSTEQTLLALVGVGVRTGEVMTEELLDELFQFLESTPKYRLSFSSLPEASLALERLI